MIESIYFKNYLSNATSVEQIIYSADSRQVIPMRLDHDLDVWMYDHSEVYEYDYFHWRINKQFIINQSEGIYRIIGKDLFSLFSKKVVRYEEEILVRNFHTYFINQQQEKEIRSRFIDKQEIVHVHAQFTNETNALIVLEVLNALGQTFAIYEYVIPPNGEMIEKLFVTSEQHAIGRWTVNLYSHGVKFFSGSFHVVPSSYYSATNTLQVSTFEALL